MIRFWRGFKQDALTSVESEKNINQNFISKTIEVGGGRGLVAYCLRRKQEDKPVFIPDEIALINYSSSETYTAIRSTPEGGKYGPLHFEKGYFAQINAQGVKSGSVVGEEYQGEVEIATEGRAYLLGSSEVNWQEGVSLRRALLPKQNLSSLQVQVYLNELQANFSQMELKGAIALVDPQYLVLILNARNQKAAKVLDAALNSLEKESFTKLDHIIFSNQKYKSTQLTSGTGISVQFEAMLTLRLT